MSNQHVAASGPKARELVDVVLAEFDRWAQLEPTLADVRAELMDHLIIPIGVTLASWGIDDDG